MAGSKTNVDTETLAKQLWALGDPVRLQILQILPTDSGCEHACNVSTIAERIGLSQPATSHHLRILRQAGIISNEKKCRDMIYWIDTDESRAVCAELQQILQRGE